MKRLFISLRSFSWKGSSSIRVVSLSIGLTIGLVLIAKVCFELSYNRFFPDNERIYLITSNHITPGSAQLSGYTSGGVAIGAKGEIPGVETATRFTGIAHDDLFITSEKNKYYGTFILGDTCLFDVFPRNILEGNAKEILSRPMYAMVSSELAEKMGGISKAIGQTFQIESAVGRVLTIGGVFEKLPSNTHLKYDVVISMASVSGFIPENPVSWEGRERFYSYVKLLPQVSANQVKSALQELYRKYNRTNEADRTFELKPLVEIHNSDSRSKQNILLLSLLAFTLLFTTIMNYTLILVSRLVNRSKEMAIHKCHGASRGCIYGKILSETFVDFFFALLLTCVLIFLSREYITSLLRIPFGELITGQTFLLLSFVCFVVFILSGSIPGYLYTRIPVSTLFRRFTESKRSWKLSMLFMQFVVASLFFTLLAIIGKQYNYMVNYDPGYNSGNIAYCNLAGINTELRRKAFDEITRLPEVEQVTTADDLLFEKYEESKIMLPGDTLALFHVANLSAVGDGFLDLLDIPVIEGRSFREEGGLSGEVMVSRSFIDKIRRFTGWEDGVTGKSICIGGDGQDADNLYTICGVYEEIHLGIIDATPPATSVLFYTHQTSHNILIKFREQTPEAIQRVSDLLNGMFPDKEVVVRSYTSVITNLYADSRHFRNAVILGGIVALAICLTGLIGYTSNEMNRRQKETAVRKVNGATISDIQLLFVAGILPVFIPALILGSIMAYLIAVNWLESFSERTTLPVFLFLICGVALSAVIIGTACLNAYRFSIADPARIIKNE